MQLTHRVPNSTDLFLVARSGDLAGHGDPVGRRRVVERDVGIVRRLCLVKLPRGVVANEFEEEALLGLRRSSAIRPSRPRPGTERSR